MSYNKQVWATGIPERTKLMKMDEGISSIDQSKLDKPTNTGTTGQVLKKTATGTEWANGSGLPEYTSEDFRKPLKAATSGPMWGTIDGEYVSYDSSQNYGVNTVGRAIKEQSEKIANKVIIDTTQEIKVGTYTDSNGTKDIYQSTIVVNNLSFGSHIHDSIDISSLSIDRILSYNVVADNSDHTYSQPMGNGGGQSLSAERFNVGRYNATYLYYYLGNEYSSLFTSMLITIQYIKL